MSSSDWIIIPTIGENRKNMVPNHQPVIKVEFPMIFHKTIGLPYDAKHMISPLDFRKNMFSPLGRAKKNIWHRRVSTVPLSSVLQLTL